MSGTTRRTAPWASSRRRSSTLHGPRRDVRPLRPTPRCREPSEPSSSAGVGTLSPQALRGALRCDPHRTTNRQMVTRPTPSRTGAYLLPGRPRRAGCRRVQIIGSVAPERRTEDSGRLGWECSIHRRAELVWRGTLKRADHTRVRWIRRPGQGCAGVRLRRRRVAVADRPRFPVVGVWPGAARPGSVAALRGAPDLVPDRDALDSYMEDPRRHALLAAFGDVFTSKQAVEVELLGETSLI